MSPLQKLYFLQIMYRILGRIGNDEKMLNVKDYRLDISNGILNL